MKRCTVFGQMKFILLCLGLIVASSADGHAQSGDRRTYTLATATTGGTSHPVGVTLSTLIKLKLLPNAGIDLDAINSQGSAENIELLRTGEAHFGILTNLDAYYSWTGTGPVSERGPDKNLRAATSLWRSTHHFVIRKEFVETGTISDFANLKGRKVSLGRGTSGTRVKHRVLFANLGIDIDQEFILEDLGYSASAKAFIAGEIDGMGLSAGVPVSALETTIEALGDEAVVLTMTDDQIATADGGLDLWSPEVIPAGSYPGQTDDLPTMATNNILGVSSEVSDEEVYQIIKTIFDNLPALHEMHKATKGIDLENALVGLPMPIHPGALRYYKEVGINVPLLTASADGEIAGEAFLTRFRNSDEAREQLNAGTVGILGGQASQTSARITDELAAYLDAPNVRVIGMNSKGSGQNIADVLYLKGVDGALVQLDVLNYAAQENAYPAIRNSIVYATELFPEEVHVVAAKGLNSLRDLIGQKVNIGAHGSGAELTSAILFDSLDLSIVPTHYEPHAAIELLKAGEIAAAIFVSGKPAPLLQQIKADDGLTLLPVPALEAEAYKPAEIDADDYPALLEGDQTISTIGVRTALITYNWNGESPRYSALSRFVDAFFSELEELQQVDIGAHPKWKEIDLLAEIDGWQRFVPAEQWIETNRDALRASSIRNATALAKPAGGPFTVERLVNNDTGELMDAAPASRPLAKRAPL
ncbi:MAG: TAXI family TRAP transporter solute-binding subunit [Geminicoccaceae bacterium]